MKNYVLVTGSEEHQGLAVIRGLGLKNIPVIAAGTTKHNLGFHSRFASVTENYASPFEDEELFIEEILSILRRYPVELIIPAVESTLVTLDNHRPKIEALCPIAAPDPAVLSYAIDKLRTINLAQETGVPVPRTIYESSRESILEKAKKFSYPLALKPRGNRLYAHTRNQLGFKVRYARSHDQLKQHLNGFSANSGFPLIQEYISGIGVCVSAVFDRGQPLLHFPYIRRREVPITGGVSVLRESLPLDPRLQNYVNRLLCRIGWHGVAMVEFKYDAQHDTYTLMEINGRFQASTALSLDAGLNIPYAVYSIFNGAEPFVDPNYQIGVHERWLRGDLHALKNYLSGETARQSAGDPQKILPTKSTVIRNFLRDFELGMHYDEFKFYDLKPGLLEAGRLGKILGHWLLSALKRLIRHLLGW